LIVAEVWGVLGYDETASSIARAMRDTAGINVIQGPPGVGKSWLAKGIGALWEDGGGGTVIAEGDVLHSDIALYPLGFAMAGLSSGWSSVAKGLTGIAEAGESLIGTGGVLTATVETLTKLRRRRRRARKLYLGDAEQAILFQLERLGRRRPLLLVADNLHWWDPSSLAFLARLRQSAMGEAFPFLQEMRLLAVRTTEPYQRVVHPEAERGLLTAFGTRYFTLSRVPRDRFADVLIALNPAVDPSPDVVDSLYRLSGGHLALAQRCATRLRPEEDDALFLADDFKDFVRALLTERLESLGALGSQMIAVLQVAAILGLTFRREELYCVVGQEESDMAHLLRHCRDEDLLELSEAVGRFVHDLYRQHFLDLVGADRARIHERLSRCLRILRPGDYEARCLNALDAERDQEAGRLAIHAVMQLAREGRPSRDLPPAILGAIENARLGEAHEGLIEALAHLHGYRFQDCLATLNRLPHDLPKSILAEADYLRASSLMSTRSEVDRGRGRAILEPWQGYEADEPELGIRLLLLLLYGLTHQINKDAGRALAEYIRHALMDRAGFDITARDALYTLDRSSGSLDPPDVSLIRTEEAADYYAPADEESTVRRPTEYYRCLVNLCAKLISNARYEHARAVHTQVERLIEDYTDGTFPRIEYARTNGLLADYRAGAADADESVARQRGIVASLAATTDPFYIYNALAVYMSLAGQHEGALAVLDKLDLNLIRSRPEPEPSMVYLIRANRAAVRFVIGDVSRAVKEWSELDIVVQRITYEIRPMLIRRHELLAGVLAAGCPMSALAFDECLTADRIEFGPLWDNFGRGFRMPEVEFWREN
jgi:hypothetical protein